MIPINGFYNNVYYSIIVFMLVYTITTVTAVSVASIIVYSSIYLSFLLFFFLYIDKRSLEKREKGAILYSTSPYLHVVYVTYRKLRWVLKTFFCARLNENTLDVAKCSFL